MKLLCYPNGLIIRAITKETCICGNSIDGHCTQIEGCSQVEGFTVVIFDGCDGSRLIVDEYGLPNYKWDEQLQHPVDSTPEDFRSNSELWGLYHEKATNQYSNGDIDTIPLDVLKDVKIHELRDACNNAILVGFDSTVKYNTSKHYGYTNEDQLNINAHMQNILLEELTLGYDYNVYYKHSEMSETELWSHADFKALFIESEQFKKFNLDTFYSKREDVQNATTKEAVMNISW